MSQDAKKPQGAPKPQNFTAPQAGAAVSDNCKSDECKKKSTKFGFCADHYEMYMAGVIRGDGKKPSDYAEKFANWQLKHRKVA